jgi:hypothetical protein
MMLTIGKPTEYASDGMAAGGQTDLDKAGWRLRYFKRGEETEIYRGSFAMCRRIQEASETISESKDSIEWMEALRELAAKLSGLSRKLPTVTLTEPTAAYTNANEPNFESPTH